MCSRYDLDAPADAVARVLAAAQLPTGPLTGVDWPALSARTAGARNPGDAVLALLADPRPGRGALWVGALRWGLVPHWVADPGRADAPHAIDATRVATTTATWDAWAWGRRCILPATRLWAWQWTAQRGLVRYRLTASDGAPVLVAGLWTLWRDRAGARRPLPSCAVLTTAAEGALARINGRMPLALAADDVAAWLNPEAPLQELTPLLKPYPAEGMTAEPIDGPPGARGRAGRSER